MEFGIYSCKNSFSDYTRSISASGENVGDNKLPKSVNRDRADFSREAFKSAREAEADTKQEPAAPKAKAESAQDSGNFRQEQTSRAESPEKTDETEKPKTLAEMVKEQMEKIDNMFSENEYDKSKDTRLSGIRAKMYRGLTLNSSEQQYLASKDPDTYSKFQQMESARKMFRCNLRACRTRDEVNSMRLSNALTALSEYRKAVRNGGDGNAIAGLNQALENEIKSYASSSDYQRLPTAAECNKFDRELAKAKRYEAEKRLEDMKARINKHYRKKRKTVGDGKRTVAQVLASPLARKVLASRRRSCGCSCGAGIDLCPPGKYKLK